MNVDELNRRARRVMSAPVVMVQQNREGVWVAEAVDFESCASIVASHSSRKVATDRLGRALLAGPKVKR